MHLIEENEFGCATHRGQMQSGLYIQTLDSAHISATSRSRSVNESVNECTNASEM